MSWELECLLQSPKCNDEFLVFEFCMVWPYIFKGNYTMHDVLPTSVHFSDVHILVQAAHQTDQGNLPEKR